MSNKVLIFDFDGTIADTFHFAVNISNRLAVEYNYKIMEPNELESLKDKSVYELIEYLNFPILKSPILLIKAHKEMSKYIELVEPAKGLKNVLIKLKSNGIKMGIVTSNSLSNVKKFLKKNELEIFDFINSSSIVLGKNRRLCSVIRKNKFNPDCVLYVGDESRDIEAAKKSGVKSVAVTWGYNSKKCLKAHNPDYLISNPEELFEICEINVDNSKD